MASLLDDISPGAKCLLNILLDAWAWVDEWPYRQYVEHKMATAGQDLRDVLRDLPEWKYGYRAIRVLRASVPLPNAPPELGDRLVPTVYGLAHSGRGDADQMVKVFLASVQAGYACQRGFSPHPVKVKPVTLSGDELRADVRQIIGQPFGEGNPRQVRLMLAGEPATWQGVSPDPDSPDWEWKLWFGSLGPFAVETGPEYLAALEESIGSRPEPEPSGLPVVPSALPRALDHLDLVWLLRTKQRLFRRPEFARMASLAESANTAEEFEARCNALSDVFSRLAVPEVEGVEGTLNFLKAALTQQLSDTRRQRALDAVDVIRDVVAVRRGQVHSGAAPESRKAAARLGIRLTGDWAKSWDRVRQVTIEAIYVLTGELEADLTPPAS